MNHWTIMDKIIPVLDGMVVDWIDEKRNWQHVTFDMDNLTHVNFIRSHDGKSELPHLRGYCMSTGCSCRHPNGSKSRPDCGLFRCYDEDGIKKDFIYQLLGI